MSNTINPSTAFPVEWTRVTPAMAEEWLGKNEGNRNKRPLHIAKIVRDLTAGNFLPTGDSIKFDWNGRLIDGQHRLSSIIAAGVPMWTLVVRGLDPKVRSVLDTNAKRSGADALYFEGVEGMRLIIAAMAKLDMAKAAGKIRTSTDTTAPNATNIEIVNWERANPDADRASRWAHSFYKSLGCPPSPLAFCILHMARIDAEQAHEFIASAAEHRTNGLGDPRLTMTKTFAANSGGGRGTISSPAAISIIFRAWNAWRSDKTLTTLPLMTRSGGVKIPEPR